MMEGSMPQANHNMKDGKVLDTLYNNTFVLDQML